MLSGSCACGAVGYQIRSPLYGPVNHCHCWRCRKQSGASFGTSASVRRADLVFTSGADSLAFWESSPGVRRHFAACCGTPIFKTEQATPEEARLRLGSLDADPEVTIELHYMVGSKAPWVAIADGLRQEQGGPPFGERD